MRSNEKSERVEPVKIATFPERLRAVEYAIGVWDRRRRTREGVVYTDDLSKAAFRAQRAVWEARKRIEEILPELAPSLGLCPRCNGTGRYQPTGGVCFRCGGSGRGRTAKPAGPPKFHRIAAGDYETADGVFRLRQLDGGATRAWNVEWTTEFEGFLLYSDDAPKTNGVNNVPGYPVDGARTKRDALDLFAKWYAENGHPAPEWRRKKL